jgi:hypothetical protein
MTMRVRSIGIIQTAKTVAALYALIGIILGIAAFFVYLFAPARSTGGGGIVPAILAVIFIPIFYGILGFVGVAIAAWIYNFVAEKTGGVEFTTTSVG